MNTQMRTVLISALVILVGALGSCKKFNGIDNNSVITKPYALYFSDTLGMLMHTTDGSEYDNVFQPEGVPMRSIFVGNSNIVFIKNNLHLSADNGKNFNYKFTDVNPFARVQQMLLNVKSHNRLYVTSTNGSLDAYSEDEGNTWKIDTKWDPNIQFMPTRLSSFAQLDNGVLFTIEQDSNKIYRRNDVNSNWKEVNRNNTLPMGGEFFITAFKNQLIACDYSSGNGLYSSQDEGQTWTLLPISTGLKIKCCAKVYDQLLIGVEGWGLFSFKNNSLTRLNLGLSQNTTVTAIVGKYNLYKNDANIQSMYVCTSDGLYKSDNLGSSWVLAKPGPMGCAY